MKKKMENNIKLNWEFLSFNELILIFHIFSFIIAHQFEKEFCVILFFNIWKYIII